jgi:hypothetical protein
MKRRRRREGGREEGRQDGRRRRKEGRKEGGRKEEIYQSKLTESGWWESREVRILMALDHSLEMQSSASSCCCRYSCGCCR